MRLADPAIGIGSGAESAPQASAQPSRGWSSLAARHTWLPAVAVLAAIIGVELLTFGASYKRTGFYLDDWLMLQQLSFGPQNYFDLVFTYLTTDPRVIIRPVEALHFGTVFFFSGTDPIGWRVSNMVMEIASAFLVFLVVSRLSLNRLIGLIASIFFLTYPVHDSTHYWAVCSCVSLSLTLYLLSLWATLKAAGGKVRVPGSRVLWLPLAFTFYTLSIYGYEPFLPLCALNVVAYVMLTSGFKPFWPAAGKLVLHSLPYAAIVASLLLYQRFIVPLFAKPSLHKIHFDPGLIVSTMLDGLQTISPLTTAPFISKQVQTFVQNGEIDSGNVTRIAVLVVLVCIGIFATARKETRRTPAVMLMSLGLLTILASYSIFGLNPEYKPTLITLVNRINTGAAFGLSMIVAGLASLVLSGGSRVKLLATGAVLSTLVVLFTLTNWSLSRPWEASWSVQKRTFQALSQRKDEFKNARSVVLMNCPRYVDATPVFDGPWDFEECLQIALGRRDVVGGVVSERMIVGRDYVQDVTLGFACGEYPYKNQVLITPGLAIIAEISSPQEFIDTVEKHGTFFGLSREAIAEWRKQLEFGTRRKKNGVLEPLTASRSQTTE